MIAGLLLAAGAGRRYGQPKALVGYGGRLLIEHAAATLHAGGCAPVVVVVGAAAAEVRDRARLACATIVDNPRWRTGMGSSLRVGLAALDPTPATAVVILLVDTPGITPAAVARLVALTDRDALTGPDALASATYGGRRGHPVLLGRAHWVDVAAQATGDAGARQYLVDHHALGVPCEDVADPSDLDRPAGANGTAAAGPAVVP